MADNNGNPAVSSAPQERKIKDDSILSILSEANDIINEFEGKPKDPPPQLKLCEGNETNEAAKRAKLMMAAQQQQQIQARQQKQTPSPLKRKSPASTGPTQQQQIQRPPQLPRQQQNVGDSGVNSNTMAQMLGVLMARVDFLEKDNTKSKEVVQRVKTLETSIEKISMIINKLSNKIDNIPKGTTDATEALIKQVDIMKEKFNDSKALLQRLEKLERHGGTVGSATLGETGNETMLARVATLEENVNTTTDRLVGLRIRTKTLMTRLDSFEDVNRGGVKSPNDGKKTSATKSLSNETTNELVMKVDYLEQLVNSLKGGKVNKPSQVPINQQVLMARVEALEDESRKKVSVPIKSVSRGPNISPRANITPNITKRINVKNEPFKNSPPSRNENSAHKTNAISTKNVNKRNSLDDVIDTGMILDLLEEIEQEKDTPETNPRSTDKPGAVIKQKPLPSTSDTSECEDSGNESLSKFLSNKKKFLSKANGKGNIGSESMSPKYNKNKESLADVEPIFSSKSNMSDAKHKAPVKISLKMFKKQSDASADENNNQMMNTDEKQRFGSSLFDSLPLTSPSKDDSRQKGLNLGMTTNKRAQKYFKKGGPRHKFFS